MCDTIVLVGEGRVLFAKNSDRDPNEAQVPEWHPRTNYPEDAQVQCTYLSIPQVRETHACLISRPVWMWGAEMGANEHGVAIGNEAVFTDQPYAKIGLTGMDLLRLGLERGATAKEALDCMVQLLERHGQGGGCGYENRKFTYHNSYLIADPHEAYVLETAGKKWAEERITEGARSISNSLSIPSFANRHSHSLITRIANAHARQCRTAQLAKVAREPADLFAILRDYGEGRATPEYSIVNGAMSAPCMHAGGIIAASQTTASWVSELGADECRHWLTATAAPDTSLFKPFYVGQPADIGPIPGLRADNSLWWRHEHFHRRVMRDPARLIPLFQTERDALEAAWLANPPSTAEAVAIHTRLLDEWGEKVTAEKVRDTRPFFVRSYWKKRDKWAGIK